MGTSLTEKASARAEQAGAGVRLALSEGNGPGALYAAIAHLRAEAAKVRRRDPARAALIDAELAGSVLAIGAELHAYRPERPVGCPRTPRPEDLLVIFEAQLTQTAEERGSRG